MDGNVKTADANGSAGTNSAATRIILPLALAQFIASFAATNMNVAITSIAGDIGTTVSGVQTAITLFTLTMAALMIPGSKLTDLWGRKHCLLLGLAVYGLGALIASLAPSLLVMILGFSLLEGVGSALMIPPLYILITALFTDPIARAKNFGILSAAAGIGAAAGPLIGGLITSAISWRASFALQVLVVAGVILLSRQLPDTARPPRDRPAFDIKGTILSALGLIFIVAGILQTNTYGWLHLLSPVWLCVAIGLLFLAWFFAHIRAREASGGAPLVSARILQGRVSNLGLTTQTAQWLIMQGAFFVVSVFLQTIRGYSAIQTGLTLTPATIGILLSSAAAARMARRRPQAQLIQWGFLLAALGLALLLLLAHAHSHILAFVPGLFTLGFGTGVMLTASVNVVQSSFPDADQGEISGVSRSVSNLGSSLGTALVGSILVSAAIQRENVHYIAALLTMAAIAVIGWLVARQLPVRQPLSPSTGSSDRESLRSG